VIGLRCVIARAPDHYNERMRNLFLSAMLVVGLVPAVFAQNGDQQRPPRNEISADQGPCSVDLVVTGRDAKPIYMAKVSSRVQYGLLGAKRIDLEAYTDPQGLLTITHLPEFPKKPIQIRIAKNGNEIIVEAKPETRCHDRIPVLLPQ